MSMINLKIDKEGLKKLSNWAKSKLSEKDQDELADILDDIFDFSGVGGAIIEVVDGKVFRAAIKTGVDAIFPATETPPPA